MYSISSNTSFNSDAGHFQQPGVSINIGGMNETAIAPASFQALPVTHTYLETALQSAQAKLQQFALSSNVDKLNFVFGTDWNRAVMQSLLTEWQQGNFSNLPQIDLLTGTQLNGANGAYSAETNTIYLSTDVLLNPGNAAKVTNVLLEEIGHAIDSKINATDTPGDEGDLFQRMIQGTAITSEEVMMLKAEDDTAILSLNNRTFLVEQSTVRPFNGTSDGIVNIRRGPGTNHTAVGSLQLNQRVTFDAVATGTTHWDARERMNENRWFRIQGTNNWVSAAFITGNPIATPTTPPPSSNTFTGSSDGIVNIRRGPGTNNSIAGTLQLNQRVTFDSVARGTTHWDARERFNDDRWFRIQGTNNWVSAAFITGGPSNVIAPPPTTPGGGTSQSHENFFAWANGQIGISRLDRADLRGQCVTLIARYIQDVYLPDSQDRVTRAFGHGRDTAREVARLFPNHFEPHTSDGLPRRGAVISFPTIGVIGGITYGHVAIVMESRVNNGQRQVRIMDSNSDSQAERSTVRVHSHWINVPDGTAQRYGGGIYWTNPR